MFILALCLLRITPELYLLLRAVSFRVVAVRHDSGLISRASDNHIFLGTRALKATSAADLSVLAQAFFHQDRLVCNLKLKAEGSFKTLLLATVPPRAGSAPTVYPLAGNCENQRTHQWASVEMGLKPGEI